MDVEPDVSPAPAPWWRRLAARLGRLRLPRPSRIVLLAAAAAGLYFLLVQAPPVWPFLTTGRIYVESPGVYTRERLVNDRYSQDFWLKSQLTLLDQSKDLVRQYRLSRAQLGAATGEAAPEPERVVLAFQDELLLRAAIRDKIRQMILENLLDDRHDLTGNSIYGLKFDTAVVPGTNTYARPYVVVRIQAETLPEGKAPGAFLAEAASANNAETGGAFAATRQQYNGWRLNVESRLNGYLEQAARAEGCAGPAAGAAAAAVAEEAAKAAAFREEAAVVSPASVARPAPAADEWRQVDRGRILSALRNVLGVEAREVTFRSWPAGAPFGTIRIPEPWSRFFQVQVVVSPELGVSGAACGTPSVLRLKPVFATLLLVSVEDWQAFAEAAPLAERQRVTIIGSTGQQAGGRQVVVVFQQQQGDMWAPDETERAFAESLTEPEIASLRERGDGATGCILAGDDGGCLLAGETYVVHASQYDFIRAIAKSVPYSYAVFPRGDVEGVINDRELAAGLRAAEEGAGGIGFSGLQVSREVGAEPVVVNFAGGQSRSVSSGAFDFGWAIVRPGRQRPAQVSQLVLVSVPAYLDKLVLGVETGWLDRDANPKGLELEPDANGGAAPADGPRRLTRMTVALPPDYEAIDTLVVGGTRRQGPVIDDLYFADRKPVVRACGPASILIPGERLWRSTSVTLGGQIADRITVLPDMRGIVASFEQVDTPPGAAAGEPARGTLSVWTSEGRDDVLAPVEILVPAEAAGGCPAQAAATE